MVETRELCTICSLLFLFNELRVRMQQTGDKVSYAALGICYACLSFVRTNAHTCLFICILVYHTDVNVFTNPSRTCASWRILRVGSADETLQRM